MKNKLFRNLSAFALALAFALSLTACTPEIHIHTGNESSTNATVSEQSSIASTEESASQNDKTNSVPETSIASSEPKTSGTSDKQSTASSTASSDGSNISRSKAKSIALSDAGLKESEIYDYEIELDYNKNTLVYDISFEYKNKDYDYEINAKTGKIVSVEKPNATSSEAKISKSKAKSTALNHAGVKEADISRYQVELEKDDGVWKYEISFNVGKTEYDYTINAENGKILESEKDIDD